MLQRRPLLLSGAAAAAVIAGHALDALGLLPGVDEPAAVRAAALAPHYTAMTVVGAGLIAMGAEALLRRRRPWFAVLVLVAGQTALLGLPEALAEAEGGAGAAPTAGGEVGELTKLAVAVSLQVVLAAAAVGIAVLIDALLLRLPRAVALLRIPDVRPFTLCPSATASGRIVGGVRGRGPPVPVFH